MKSQSLAYKQTGFTLIELMVVIVIIGLLAALVMMNIDGVDQRKAMQARELLMMDLKQIARQANYQSRIYALVKEPATDVTAFRYYVEEYQPAQMRNASGLLNHQKQNDVQKTWIHLEEFADKTLAEHVSFSIEPQDHRFENAQNTDLVGSNAPKLIWFGNGEAKPVSIQIYYDQQPIGDLIQIDYLGKVTDEK